MRIRFTVRRQDETASTPFWQTYEMECQPNISVLDALRMIALETDPSLVFRENCYSAVCGDCGLRANGREVLGCKVRIDDLVDVMHGEGQITVEPLRWHRVIRDLVVDREDHFRRLGRCATFVEGPQDDGPVDNSIMVAAQTTCACTHCGICLSGCQAYPEHGAFVGPAALAWTLRFLIDPRDAGGAERIAVAVGENGVAGCVDCGQCDEVCPESINPFAAIKKLR
jgi:succinate dehydrogenase/fumarate reductase iron-sulfur protein